MKFGVFIAIFLIGIILIGVMASIWSELADAFDIGAVDNVTTTVTYENITTGDSNAVSLSIASDNIAFQTFQAASSHNISSISIKGYISGETDSSILAISVYAIDSDYYPTGTALGFAYADLSDVATSSPGDWVTATFDDPIDITSGTYYDIVTTYTGADGSAFIWRVDSTTASQLNWAYSSDSGSTWVRNVCTEQG